MTLLRQLVSHSVAHFINMVEAGNAITIPSTPRSEPQTDRERMMIAGLRPNAFPMIFGVSTISEKVSTNTYTARHSSQIIQKSVPVSMDLNTHITVTGISER